MNKDNMHLMRKLVEEFELTPPDANNHCEAPSKHWDELLRRMKLYFPDAVHVWDDTFHYRGALHVNSMGQYVINEFASYISVYLVVLAEQLNISEKEINEAFKITESDYENSLQTPAHIPRA